MAQTLNKKQSFLEFFPLTLFAGVASLSTLAVAWGFTGWRIGLRLKEIFGLASAALFVILSIIYGLKWWRYPEIIKKDFADPIGINLFGVFFISLLIMSGILYNYDRQLAFVIWIIGTLSISTFSWIVLNRWFNHPQNPQNALPLWLVPLFGILDVPLTGLRYPSPEIKEICLFFYVTALLFTAILIVVIFTRLLFQAELAAPMYPTLLLLSVPFSFAYTIYDILTDGITNLIATFFYYGALFVATVFGRKIFFSMIKVQFSASFWTVSFPLAALTTAAFRYASHSKIYFIKVIPFLLLAGTNFIVIILFLQTFHFIIAEFIIKSCPKPSIRMTFKELIEVNHQLKRRKS